MKLPWNLHVSDYVSVQPFNIISAFHSHWCDHGLNTFSMSYVSSALLNLSLVSVYFSTTQKIITVPNDIELQCLQNLKEQTRFGSFQIKQTLLVFSYKKMKSSLKGQVRIFYQNDKTCLLINLGSIHFIRLKWILIKIIKAINQQSRIKMIYRVEFFILSKTLFCLH